MLRVVDTPREQWDRRDGETDNEHALFWLWVRQGAPALTGEALALALDNEWTARHHALTARLEPPATPREQVEQTQREIDSILWMAIRKIARDERHTKALVTPIRDLKLLLEIKSILAGVQVNAEASTLPLDQLPQSALDEIEKAVAHLDALDRKVG